MILLGKNANLLEIHAPATPADPGKGISASVETVRWQGCADAYVDEDLVDQVKGGMRVTVSQTILDLPMNLPVWPQLEDILIVQRIGAFANAQVPNAAATGPAEQAPLERLIVRFFDGGLLMLGKTRFKCVRS